MTTVADILMCFLFSLSETLTSKSNSVLTDVTWSSNGSDVSNEVKTHSESHRDNGHGSRM